MQTWTYPATFEELDGEIVVRFADFPEALTGGATDDEARAEAADALEEVVLAYLALNRPIPEPRAAGDGEIDVPLEPLTAGRAAIATLMKRQRVTKVDLAARIRKDEKLVRRILDGTDKVSMDTVTLALRALGAQPSLALEVA